MKLSYIYRECLGGFDELLKGAGKDATSMFNDAHKWVDYDSMLKASY